MVNDTLSNRISIIAQTQILNFKMDPIFGGDFTLDYSFG